MSPLLGVSSRPDRSPTMIGGGKPSTRKLFPQICYMRDKLYNKQLIYMNFPDKCVQSIIGATEKRRDTESPVASGVEGEITSCIL